MRTHSSTLFRSIASMNVVNIGDNMLNSREVLTRENIRRFITQLYLPNHFGWCWYFSKYSKNRHNSWHIVNWMLAFKYVWFGINISSTQQSDSRRDAYNYVTYLRPDAAWGVFHAFFIYFLAFCEPLSR